MVHICKGILLSHKKNRVIPFAATWMQLEILILSDVSQKQKYKYHMISLVCGNLQYGTNNLTTQHKETNGHREQTCCQGGGGGRGMDWEFGVSEYKLLHLERINRIPMVVQWLKNLTAAAWVAMEVRV